MSSSSELTRMSPEEAADRLLAMREQEENAYNYQRYFPKGTHERQINVQWREKIVTWAYHVIDHFDLSREVVAISLDLFDRFLATRNNVSTGNQCLLVSLTTLHIAIKVHDRKKIKIQTLANLSRGQFTKTHIEEMEWEVLAALQWKLHPPSLYSFVHHLLQFLPVDASTNLKRDIHELSRYLTELSVCDSFFISYHKSTIAFAAILNVLDQISLGRISAGTRERFLRDVLARVGLCHLDHNVEVARDRLRTMLSVTAGSENQPPLTQTFVSAAQDNDIGSLSSSSNGSFKDSSKFSGRGRSNSVDSRSRRRFMASVSPMTRSQRSSSPMVASIQ